MPYARSMQHNGARLEQGFRGDKQSRRKEGGDIMMVRLKKNVILGKKSYPRHSFVELDQLPPHLRNDKSMFETDAVLVLRELDWHIERVDSEGVKTAWPANARPGATISLGSLPRAYRQTLIDGVHYKSDWTLKDQHKIFDSEEERYQQAHSMEPPSIESLSPSPQGGR
jgi:hypothetical protein